MGGQCRSFGRKFFDSVKGAFSGSKKHELRDAHGTKRNQRQNGRSNSDEEKKDDIAIVGMACRFPGAGNYREYWHLLINGVNAIKEIPSSRWDVNEYYSPDIDVPGKSISKWCGLVGDIDKFDNRFFNISPREAKSMDPQQRLLLQEAWHCIEDSGIALSHLQKKKTSVYIGVMAIDYYGEAAQNDQTDSYACLGNYECILANRLSYYFGLTGASISIDAACASSLIAIHEAKTSLRSSDCDYAIAGGVSLNFHPFKYISFSKSRMLSPDGQCRTFSADANGYVPGDGVGLLLLQRLSDAERDGNHIYGVIKGSAMNHTGPSLSITAPRMEAQRDVVLGALQDAGMHAETVSYVEAHGTGTSLGDPIEVESLTRAFREYTDKRGCCRIGSVKSNIGHLEAAAGVAGVIKVLLMMQHHRVPKTLNVTELNPIIDFKETPFEVALEPGVWEPTEGEDLLHAGVSSFGFGGANSHVLLEQYPSDAFPADETYEEEYPFVLSARSSQSMEALIAEWKTFVQSDQWNQISFRDICLTTLSGRASFPFRAGLVCKNKAELTHFISGLGQVASVDEGTPVCLGIGDVAFQGFAQLAPAYESVPPFRKAVDEITELLRRQSGTGSLVKGFKKQVWHEKRRALYGFIANYAIARAYMESGVVFELVMGRGAGALVSLVVSGIVELEDALLVLRGKKKIDSIVFSRPRIPMYDTVHGEIVNPYHLDEAYVRDVIENMELGDETAVSQILMEEIAHASGTLPAQGGMRLGTLLVRRNIITVQQLEEALAAKSATGQLLGSILVEKGFCTLRRIEDALSQQELLRGFVAKARLLEQSQFTFKKYLAEWDEALGKFGRRVRDLLGDEDLLRSSGRTRERERLLLQVIILSSLRRLQQKWNLADKALMPDQRFNELVDLLLDKALPEEQLVSLLLSEHPDYRACAELLDARQHMMKPERRYAIARSHNRGLATVGHHASWYEGLSCSALRKPDGYVLLTIDGEGGDAADVLAAFSQDVKRAFEQSLFDLWLKGTKVCWEALYPEGTFQKVALPTYAFETKSFWIEGHASMETVRQLPEEQPRRAVTEDRLHFSHEFTREDPIVRDHIITGKHLIPAAGMIDVGFDAASKMSADPVVTLTKVTVMQPGMVDEPLSLDVKMGVGDRSFTIWKHSLELCKGRYDRRPFVPLPPMNKGLFVSGHSVALEELYSRFIAAGYQYGESLRVIKAAWKRGETYIFKLESTGADFLSDMNPHLLDGMFQCVLAVQMLEGTFTPGDKLFVPYMVGSLSFDGKERDSYYVAIYQSAVRMHKDAILASFSAYDADGRNVIRVDDMVFMKVDNQFLTKLQAARAPVVHSKERHEVYLYKPVWERKNLERRSGASHRPLKFALVFTDDENTINSFRSVLEAKYGKLVFVKRGAVYNQGEKSSEVNPTVGDDYQRLLDDALFSDQSEQPGFDVFYLWNYESAERTALPDMQLDACEDLIQPLFHLSKALIKKASKGKIRVVVCTKDANVIIGSDKAEGFAYGSFSGFLKTLSQEFPQLGLKLIDFGHDEAPLFERAELLFDEVADAAKFELIGYRNNERYARSIESVDLSEGDRQPAFKEGGVYLLVGGLGGLGLKIASMIADRSKARLALLDRVEEKDASEEKQRSVKILRESGCEVLSLCADVTNLEQMRSAIETIKAQWQHIDGVIQVTGLLEDRLFANKEWDSFKRVMQPKVTGTLVLNAALRDAQVNADFFVVFSSIVSVMGNRGQSDYAAANSFLDAFVHHRQAEQDHARSIAINWTLWADGGMGMDERTRKHFQDTLGLVESAQGLAALRAIVSGGEPQVIVAGRQIVTSVQKQPQKPTIPANVKLDRSKAAVKISEELEASTQKGLRGILSGILHVGRDELDDETDLKEYGLDSVALTELAEKISAELCVEFNPSLLFEYTTIAALSRYVAGKLPSPMKRAPEQTPRQKGGPSSVLLRLLSETLHVDGAEIDEDTDLKEYGLDSVALTELSEKITEALGIEFNPSLLFEYNTVASLSAYVAKKSSNVASPEESVEESLPEDVASDIQMTDALVGVHSDFETQQRSEPAEHNRRLEADDQLESVVDCVKVEGWQEGVAVIGMSGVFPGSPDLNVFWEHLKAGEDLISEIPSDRFNWKDYFGDPQTEENRMNCKWGGFIKDVDKFDAPFFNISPREAELMDPQQRLMLELSWRAIEDAGYQATEFSDTRMGVFIGVCNDDYGELLDQYYGEVEAYTSTGNYFSIIPNRVSYFLNVRGPSVAVETACSSSLIAVHQAVRAIENGECETALAGGVNILLTPKRFISFSKAGMLSPDGRCKTFDKSANGYVRGEGAGAIILKPLSNALRDGDHIYGVIKGSAENHGGRANSLTAPNPVAQAELLEEAYQRAGIDPWRISYIECHGTGTSLGDPVEVNGLKKAFEDMYRGAGREFQGSAHCGLGTVKSNIGHLESAAGMAGMIKVLLSLRYGILPGVVHFKELNPYIEVADTPLYVVNRTMTWERQHDEQGRELPRVAGVSSFGFGGANAHIVIEEYMPPYRSLQESELDEEDAQIIVLSAKDRDGLRTSAQELLQYISNSNSHLSVDRVSPKGSHLLLRELKEFIAELVGVESADLGDEEPIVEFGLDEIKLSDLALKLNERYGCDVVLGFFKPETTLKDLGFYLLQNYGELFREYEQDLIGEGEEAGNEHVSANLSDIAYTLQVGREPMQERLAVVACDLADLKEKLRRYLEGVEVSGVHGGNAHVIKDRDGVIGNGSEERTFIESLFENNNLNKLAALWANGAAIDWKSLRRERGKTRHRVPLPGYPFNHKRYWVPTDGKVGKAAISVSGKGLHDLLDTNESTLEAQCYRKVLEGNEYYLRDHVVDGTNVLPGAAYLEMARLAGDLAGDGSKVTRIRNVVWMQPVKVADERVEVNITLDPGEDGIEFDATSGRLDEHEGTLNAQGRLEYGDEDVALTSSYVDFDAVRTRCLQHMDRSACYELFAARGLAYGKSFQAIRELWQGEREVLAALELPETLKDTSNEYVLHPSLVDGAFQASIVLMGDDDNGAYVPFSLQEVSIVRQLPSRCFAHVSEVSEGKGAARIFDIEIMDEKGAVCVRLEQFLVRAYSTQESGKSSQRQLTYLSDTWVASETQDEAGVISTPMLLVGGDAAFHDSMHKKLGKGGSLFSLRYGNAFKQLNDDTFEVRAGSETDFRAALETFSKAGAEIDCIVHVWPQDVFPPSEKDIEQSFLSGVYSVFELTRAMMSLKPKSDVRYICLGLEPDGNPLLNAISGFGRSAHHENAKLSYRVVSGGGSISADELARNVVHEFASWNHQTVEVKYNGSERFERTVQDVSLGDGGEPGGAFKHGGVYVLSGGMGGLGALIAKYLAKHYAARLVLSDMREIDATGEVLMNEIVALGGMAEFVRCNVTLSKDVQHLVQQTKNIYGRINGVIHAAGLIRDSFILKKSRDEMAAVLNAKIVGAINLDRETASETLDFFVCFASISGVMGNMGQSDYAYSNRFLDNFSAWREGLRASGKRHGKSLSIDWPLWAEGGMAVDEQAKKWLKQSLGMEVLPTKDGLVALESALNGDRHQILVVYGDAQKLRQLLGASAPEVKDVRNNEALFSQDGQDILAKRLRKDVVNIVAGIVKVSIADIDIDAEMSEYGFDSITITEFTNKMSSRYSISLTPAVFFEHGSVASIVEYLLKEYSSVLSAFFAVDENKKTDAVDEGPKGTPRALQKLTRKKKQSQTLHSEKKMVPDAIAVVGMSGVFPRSENLKEFWKHLEACDDLIDEVPADRWNWEEYYGDPLKEDNKTNSKWGGFMQEVDKFDAAFFSISPHEAELMDPQQRIFLEVVWKAIEDSGHSTESLWGSRTGLFVGVSTSDYTELLQKNGISVEAHTSTGTLHSVLANRISYLLNLRGPSEPIDTACSSSLIAVHRAARAIQDGECDMAIAGGVSAILTPTLHISFGKAGMLSDDGRCKTFDKRANGYVRGEGAGAIVLKPLSKAIADGDHVYGVIKGTAENHGGHVSSLTVPNPNAQAELLIDAYTRAGVEPWRVNYIECHGTGTSLGDPVEVNGLKKAFGVLHEKYHRQFDGNAYCGLGTVKTNIGHLETAAGIAGLIKVLLALKNKRLPGVVHFQELNPYIEIEESPFYILNKTCDWKQVRNDKGDELPRVAGVSSFGFGGANAHIVVEEYEDEKFTASEQIGANIANRLIVLSAKDEERLKAYAKRLYDDLDGSEYRFNDISYTLQVGREPMDERLAFTAFDMASLREKLAQYVDGGLEGVYRGRKRTVGEQDISSSTGDADGKYVSDLIKEQNLNRLAALWVNGSEVEWEKLYSQDAERPRRISLPPYPFKRDRYWIPTSSELSGKPKMQARLHDLLDANESTLNEQRYLKELNGAEYFLRDHVVAGDKVLPGVAYIEMARVAGDLAGEGAHVRRIKDVVWMQPVRMNGAEKDVYVSLYPEENLVEYEVTSDSGAGRELNSQGKIVYENRIEKSADEQVDIDLIRSRCDKHMAKVDCYRLFDDMGLSYGKSFQVIGELQYNDREVLASLELPESLEGGFQQYVLHPSIMDGALQSVMALMAAETAESTYLPFSLGEVEIFKPLVEKCYAYAQLVEVMGEGIKKFSIDVADSTGTLLVRMKDFVVRRYAKSALKKSVVTKEDQQDILLVHEKWMDRAVDCSQVADGAVIILNSTPEFIASMRGQLADDVQLITVEFGEAYKELDGNECAVRRTSKDDYKRLFEMLRSKNVELNRIIYFLEKCEFSDESDVHEALNRTLYTSYALMGGLIDFRPREGIHILCVHEGGAVQPIAGALSGFGRSVHLESPKIKYKLLDMGKGLSVEESASRLLAELASEHSDVEIKYDGGHRFERTLMELKAGGEEESAPVLKRGGVYLITGGMGGLGLIFARYLSKEYKAKLVLSGRRDQDEKIQTALRDIEALGGEAHYIKCDVTKLKEVQELMKLGKDRFERVDGIIHAAGLLRDSFLIKKSIDDIEAVVGPKIYGAINLDLATQDDSLEIFILFSSLAGVLGNVGQCDYAFGNRFLDQFAQWREGERLAGRRRGKVVAIDWPLWGEGGMQVGSDARKWLQSTYGMVPLSTHNGIGAFERLIGGNVIQCAVVEGDIDTIKQKLGLLSQEGYSKDAQSEESFSTTAASVSDEKLLEIVESDIANLCVEMLKVKREDLDPEVDFSEYGVDSIMMMKMLNQVESMYGETVDPNAITMHPTMRQFANYLISEGLVKHASKDVHREPVVRRLVDDARPENGYSTKSQRSRKRFRQQTEVSKNHHRIAIIGMACRFPGSPKVETFWEHLRNGDNLITEIPEERWDKDAFYSPDRAALNKSYSKWGGFIEGIDLFDAAFFGISDADAVTMDPQQRIMLELTQELLDRSGYTKEEIGGTNTSLFIGAAANQYIHAHMHDLSPEIAQHIIVNNIPNMIAARISDFYDLKGSSQTIDTACSSSLVAVHEACSSLRSGQSEMAIAGGVMLLVDPYFHIGFGKAEVLSDDGRSYVFDQRAKGFVLGEGAGLILLKPLEAALRDGDRVLGVIAGSAVNNDGHTMGVTVPSMEGQEEVLRMCIEDCGVTPETIGYLEAHGTGTLLGDPIEIKAASNVFRKYTDQLQYCAVGSVKSNMGHLLTAAGIASVIKVLLAIQNEAIPPSLNCENPHPRFRFAETPFYPITKFKKWEPLHGVMRAAISSFGFGGTNCHMILEKVDSSEALGPKVTRQSLPITDFSRKSYWIGLDVNTSGLIRNRKLEDKYRQLFAQLRKGKISPREAVSVVNHEDL